MKLAAEQRQKLERNAHAKPGAFDIAVAVFLDALKLCGKLGQVFFFNADTGIFHFKMKDCGIWFCGFAGSLPDACLDSEPYSSFVRVFYRVGQQVG